MPHAVGHGARGGIGHLVRFADDERVEREFAGIEQRGGLFDLGLEKGGALRGGEELDVEIGGVNVPQGILDAVGEHGFDRAALKIVRAVEIERPVLDGHGLHLVEPRGDGRLRTGPG